MHLNSVNGSRIRAGRSCSVLFITYDEKYVIKTITSAERKLMIKILPKYCERIISNSKSKLVRIVGLYKLLPENQDFMIMENVIINKDCATVFDLKGSTVDRYVGDYGEGSKGKILKDQNFIESNLKIILPENDIKDLIQILNDDFEILKAANIMDYSILIGFYDVKFEKDNRYLLKYLDKNYAIGVIDILQEYNFTKITEKKLKSIYKKNSIMMSVADPNMYFERIVDFLHNIFVNTKNNL